MLGLAPGGSVRGVAYRVGAADWPQAHAYLLEREQPTETYFETTATTRLADGRRVSAMTFLSDQSHPQWAGVLSLEEQARLIAGATGLSGTNIDYLRDLIGHLRADGAPDLTMERLMTRVSVLEALAA